MPPEQNPASGPWQASGCDLAQLCRIAEIIALDLKAGDCVRLVGDLGAGKTTFATALLRAYSDNDALTVPSPTFTLVERYETARGVVHHADLYRLEDPDEADELGLDDALSEGALLVEWPDKAPHVAGDEHLTVSLLPCDREDCRDIGIEGTSGWAARLERLKAMATFVDAHVGPDAHIAYLQGDASTRRYAVVRGPTGEQILMDSPAQTDGPVVEDGKSYSAIAHLAETATPFVAVAQALREAGICVPETLASDLDSGFLLISHLGERVFGSAIAHGEDLRELTLQAAYVLLQLRKSPVPDVITLSGGITHVVPEQDWQVFRMETRLFTDWYVPAAAGVPAPEERQRTFEAIWRDLFEHVKGHSHWILRDYHSPNLIYRPEAKGLDRIGVIDFQDALKGHAAYDLVSLLQDARYDVPEELELEILQRYCDAARDQGPFDVAAFCTAYAILGAQRSTKILGIFARLAHRDGKPQYLAHIPRIWGYLERNLRHEALIPLQTWYSESVPQSWRTLS